jgi:hypothetical protein
MLLPGLAFSVAYVVRCRSSTAIPMPVSKIDRFTFTGARAYHPAPQPIAL